ncbi:hypothetical protein [Pseudomonas juntendi]|jgi:predicted transcriptional regulator|uniref:hypothetical protein n=1 Tax=Pseudomonas juntendi TaxID=2666183 RepID=UPI002949E0CA|nr:hypothetical protein [Pseudomonas juntendi]MDV5385058.1 hypothetical protein [Pseudomonas juntendi]
MSESQKAKPRWAKMPNRWAMAGGLKKFGEVDDQGKVDPVTINASLAALKVYLAICTRADYASGIVKTTYPELCALVGHSRNLVARSLRVLEEGGHIRRDTTQPRGGSRIYVERWTEDKGFAKIPKSWLYQGRGSKDDRASNPPEKTLIKLKAFTFGKRLSLQALKIYMLLLTMRNRDYPNGDGLTVITYDKISEYTGVKRHSVSLAINLLMEMNMISFRSGDTNTDDSLDFDRTNRYLIKGLALRYREQAASKTARTSEQPDPAQPSPAAA